MDIFNSTFKYINLQIWNHASTLNRLKSFENYLIK